MTAVSETRRIAGRVVRAGRGAASARIIASAAVRRVADPSGGVALTFDDGPDPLWTTAVLDELARLGVCATFFAVGRRAEENPHLVRRILADGHALGSHSYGHPDPWTLPVRALAADYRRGHRAVEVAAGRHVPLFRPPKGFVDVRGAIAMRLARVQPFLWTVDPHDWEPRVEAGAIRCALEGLAGGDVVLLHDAIEGPLAPEALDRSATVAALPEIAAMAAARGLRFTTLR
ncbi:polysaccharide deacetylase family protein [Baekduia soli]|uniref:Polysaccharide deacetylase family protein n=1 Tax=Baekduia soli TaxID=496014 RepID=A0A5B8U760_9ACTN|nr:polysaccharide deacetylase family protein [Baekduia soli]QEC48502.1 polysaccharide deacetylase family protein [Baekduia soli]